MNTTAPANIADIYAAPASNNSAAPKKLFSISQLGISSFFAVPIGLTLMAINYRRIGKKFESNLTIILAPIVTVLLFVIGVALPTGTFTAMIPLLVALGIRKISTQEFGKEIATIETNGGRIESSWFVAGAVVAGVIVCLVVFILFMSMLSIW